ncbi:hypothetical protein P1J78_17620 [Psychromarinibacter sp. C21-152]|uniref:Uncharacterized protein n=1 Tax=Psychromarinibacter sediminicola TaxID=3033385 RepID=A0AAE3NUX9_9RHOB|nr:hypothetical protein [Psychromarinibacter sediminicola]MDF0602561.1 hypothetical protein [Psychromarinibacter sediminicola]
MLRLPSTPRVPLVLSTALAAALAVGAGPASAQSNADILEAIQAIEQELARLRDLVGDASSPDADTPGAAVSGNLVLINVPVADPEKAVEFYSKLTGKEFLRTLTDSYEGYYAVLNDDGLRLTITESTGSWDTTKLYWATDDMDSALDFAEGEGGVRRAGPFQLDVPARVAEEYREIYADLYDVRASSVSETIGSAAVLSSPFGNLMGLIEFHPQAERWYSLGEGRSREADTEAELAAEADAAERLADIFTSKTAD